MRTVYDAYSDMDDMLRFGAVLLDFTTTFDVIVHSIHIVKLKLYG